MHGMDREREDVWKAESFHSAPILLTAPYVALLFLPQDLGDPYLRHSGRGVWPGDGQENPRHPEQLDGLRDVARPGRRLARVLLHPVSHPRRVAGIVFLATLATPVPSLRFLSLSKNFPKKQWK